MLHALVTCRGGRLWEYQTGVKCQTKLNNFWEEFGVSGPSVQASCIGNIYIVLCRCVIVLNNY